MKLLQNEPEVFRNTQFLNSWFTAGFNDTINAILKQRNFLIFPRQLHISGNPELVPRAVMPFLKQPPAFKERDYMSVSVFKGFYLQSTSFSSRSVTSTDIAF
jgi:hypothetical protein